MEAQLSFDFSKYQKKHKSPQKRYGSKAYVGISIDQSTPLLDICTSKDISCSSSSLKNPLLNETFLPLNENEKKDLLKWCSLQEELTAQIYSGLALLSNGFASSRKMRVLGSYMSHTELFSFACGLSLKSGYWKKQDVFHDATRNRFLEWILKPLDHPIKAPKPNLKTSLDNPYLFFDFCTGVLKTGSTFLSQGKWLESLDDCFEQEQFPSLDINSSWRNHIFNWKPEFFKRVYADYSLSSVSPHFITNYLRNQGKKVYLARNTLIENNPDIATKMMKSCIQIVDNFGLKKG